MIIPHGECLISINDDFIYIESSVALTSFDRRALVRNSPNDNNFENQVTAIE